MRYIVFVLFFLVAGCGNDEILQPEENYSCQGVYKYYVYNSQGGSFDITYLDGNGETKIDTVFSGWSYEFSSDAEDFYFFAIGSKPGNTSAYLYHCDELLRRVGCVCTYPILEIEYSKM